MLVCLRYLHPGYQFRLVWRTDRVATKKVSTADRPFDDIGYLQVLQHSHLIFDHKILLAHARPVPCFHVLLHFHVKTAGTRQTAAARKQSTEQLSLFELACGSLTRKAFFLQKTIGFQDLKTILPHGGSSEGR